MNAIYHDLMVPRPWCPPPRNLLCFANATKKQPEKKTPSDKPKTTKKEELNTVTALCIACVSKTNIRGKSRYDENYLSFLYV